MAYQKKQPKIMSDGNIARVGMIVVFINPGCNMRRNIARITKLYSKNTGEISAIETDATNKYTWTCREKHIRKATLEEKKQYWAELAQK